MDDYSEDKYKPNSVNSVCIPFRFYRSCGHMFKMFYSLNLPWHLTFTWSLQKLSIVICMYVYCLTWTS